MIALLYMLDGVKSSFENGVLTIIFHYVADDEAECISQQFDSMVLRTLVA